MLISSFLVLKIYLILIKKGQFEKGDKERLQRDIKFPLEPSYWILLEDPFHNYSKRLRVVLLG